MITDFIASNNNKISITSLSWINKDSHILPYMAFSILIWYSGVLNKFTLSYSDIFLSNRAELFRTYPDLTNAAFGMKCKKLICTPIPQVLKNLLLGSTGLSRNWTSGDPPFCIHGNQWGILWHPQRHAWRVNSPEVRIKFLMQRKFT